MNRPPAFQAYATDLLTLFTGLSPAAVGAIVRLWLFAWAQSPDQSSLIDDDLLLARTVGISLEDWKVLRDEIQHDARPVFGAKNGRLISDYLHGEVVKQRKYRKLQAEKGKRSAAMRSYQASTEAQPRFNSPSPISPSSPLSSSKKKKKEDEKPVVSSDKHSNGKESSDTQTPEAIRERWNAIQGVVQCKSLEGNLLERVTHLLREKSSTWWDELFGQIQESRFLRGQGRAREGRRRFRADLVWVLDPANLGTLMSGRYRDVHDEQLRRAVL